MSDREPAPDPDRRARSPRSREGRRRDRRSQPSRGRSPSEDDTHSIFLARHDRDELLHGGTPFAGTGRPDEILFHSRMPDWFRFSQPDKARVWRDFREALETCRPDVVHFHHYLHLGLEMMREVRNFDPAVKIVLTLHEYFAICHHDGPDGAPARRARSATSPRRAPARAASPSTDRRTSCSGASSSAVTSIWSTASSRRAAFLKERYVAWGLEDARVEVIENVLAPGAGRVEREDEPAGGEPRDDLVRFAFFGQVNEFKGIDVLLEAFERLPPDVRARVRLDVNGSGLERQPKALRQSVAARLRVLGSTVRLRGAYRAEELDALMAASDWMIVPSTWWENSPVVILEARRHALPVICSDLGGMAEKIEHGRTGWHFPAGRSDALAERIVRVANRRDERHRFAAAIAVSWEPDRDLERHVALYDALETNGDMAISFASGPRLRAV